MTTKWIPTPEILEKIRELAEQKVTEEEIANAIGLASSTWYKKKNEFPDIKAIMEDARKAKIQLVRSKLWKIIDDETNRNHFQALTFYLKNYDDEIIRQVIPEAPQVQLPTGFSLSIIKSKDANDD